MTMNEMPYRDQLTQPPREAFESTTTVLLVRAHPLTLTCTNSSPVTESLPPCMHTRVVSRASACTAVLYLRARVLRTTALRDISEMFRLVALQRAPAVHADDILLAVPTRHSIVRAVFFEPHTTDTPLPHCWPRCPPGCPPRCRAPHARRRSSLSPAPHMSGRQPHHQVVIVEQLSTTKGI
jgi:hypothetical protein